MHLSKRVSLRTVLGLLLTVFSFPISVSAMEGISIAELIASDSIRPYEAVDGEDRQEVSAPEPRYGGTTELAPGEKTLTTEDGSVLKWKVDSETTAKITGYVSVTPHLVIPSRVEGRDIIALADFVVGGSALPNSTFASCETLESVYLPDTMKLLSGMDFYNCKNLASVRMPSSVVYIGMSAFFGCESLRDVALPADLRTLDMEVFDGCSSLESVVIPSGLTAIPTGSFSNCSSLSSITLHDNIRSIGAGAFSGTAIREIALPQRLRTIGANAFAFCKSLASVVIPSNVTAIADGAFRECPALSSVKLPAGLESIGVRSFKETGLTEVVLPQTVRTIGDEAFLQCAQLEKAYVTGRVRSIGDGAFPSTTLILATDAYSSDAICDWARQNGCEYIRGTLGDYWRSNVDDVAFDFEPQEPAIVLTNYKGDVFPAKYMQVHYEDNVHCGRARFTVTSSLFDDKVTGSFYIDERDINDPAIEIDPIPDQDRYSEAVKPGVVMRLNGHELQADTDYYLSYDNNNAAGRGEIEISGRGDFTGERRTFFNINQLRVTVSFVMDHGTPMPPIEIDAGDHNALFRYVMDAEPKRKFSKLDSWYTDSDFTDEFDIIYDKPMTDMTLYAKWVPWGYATDPYGFYDVFDDTPHYLDIWWAAYAGISEGFRELYARLYFRPYAIVARADMAAFLYRLAGEPAFDESSAPQFTDVDASTPHRRAILWLASTGISKGWNNGNGTFSFRPYANVVRADMAAFLYRLAGEPAFDESSVPGFADVNASTPHRRAILWLASSGVSKGWDEPNGTKTFRPYLEVARCDMAAFLHRMEQNGLVNKR